MHSNHAHKRFANSLRLVGKQQTRKFVEKLDFSSGALDDLLAKEKTTDEQTNKIILADRLHRGDVIIFSAAQAPKLRRRRSAEVEVVAEKSRPVPVAPPRRSYTPDPNEEVVAKVTDESIQAQADTLNAAAKEGAPFCEVCEKARQAAA